MFFSRCPCAGLMRLAIGVLDRQVATRRCAYICPSTGRTAGTAYYTCLQINTGSASDLRELNMMRKHAHLTVQCVSLSAVRARARSRQTMRSLCILPPCRVRCSVVPVSGVWYCGSIHHRPPGTYGWYTGNKLGAAGARHGDRRPWSTPFLRIR